MSEGEKSHLQHLELALAEAEKCSPSQTAFCVGCVLVIRSSEESASTVLATGHSRELPGNTHAEANALFKARKLSKQELSSITRDPTMDIDTALTRVDVYTTMEPCSIRTSGLQPCTDALIKSNIKRCFIGVGEPDDFVVCEGARKLGDAGIEVIWLDGLQDKCLSVARRGHQDLQVGIQ